MQQTSSGWWLGHPSEKYESQLGWLETQYFWENKKWQPNHQPAVIFLGILAFSSPAIIFHFPVRYEPKPNNPHMKSSSSWTYLNDYSIFVRMNYHQVLHGTFLWDANDHLVVSWVIGVPPVIIHFSRIFPHTPSIFGFPHDYGNLQLT